MRENQRREPGGFAGEKLITDHKLFSPYEGQQGAANGQDPCGAFSGIRRALDGWMLARAPASPTQGLRRHGSRDFNFPYFCMMCGLDQLGLVDQNLLERDLSALLLRTLVVGRQEQSESIEVALGTE